MRKLIMGILAHVDAGKTTLSEAMLYHSGTLRTLGRVDHGDAFLDTDQLERERGITIFSKQALLTLGGLELTLLDTPGHVDFSAEMERTLRVLDCAILVISGSDGVQSHTRTLWQLLRRYELPVFLFVNKMDLTAADKPALLAELKEKLDGGCVDFSQDPAALAEEAAVCDEALMERYLNGESLNDGDYAALIRERKLFPCFFGSALKLEGVEDFLEALERFAPVPEYPAEFGARVFKVARDPQGARLTFLKITGGRLRTKDSLSNQKPDMEPDKIWTEKVNEIRLYSGAKYRPVDTAEAGTVCAVTGLSRSYPGQGLGFEESWTGPLLEPVLTYQVELVDGTDPTTALGRFRQLEEEDPQLHVVWNEQHRTIRLQLMGEVQLEILKRLMEQRFGMEVAFGTGSIVYRETIAAPVEGIGHFEPLRHYAEVHLLLEPGEPGSGICIGTLCPTDVLPDHWQRLVMTHLEEKTHLGVLTGSPITDMRIILIAGREHVKHTDGGDFRQATYRAVRQGLMEAESVLLEPWYAFRLEVPSGQVGRAMSDLQRMNGKIDPPDTLGETVLLTGSAPVAGLQDYAREVAAYTRGQGRLSCTPAGYFSCTEEDTERIVKEMAYDPEADLDNTPDSVFCAHGGGFTVKWYDVPAAAHISTGLSGVPVPEPEEVPAPAPRRSYQGSAEEDKELMEIFERTYGKVKERSFRPPKPPKRPVYDASPAAAAAVALKQSGPEYLLVDGYNIIYAWDELSTLAQENLDAARKTLADRLSNYQGWRKCEVILVFDAYKVKGGQGSVERYHNINIVYTKEAETADSYIEKTSYRLRRHGRVRVATSDGPEQLIILGHGALRVSASAFHEELNEALAQISGILSKNNQGGKTQAMKSALEKAQGEKREKT